MDVLALFKCVDFNKLLSFIGIDTSFDFGCLIDAISNLVKLFEK